MVTQGPAQLQFARVRWYGGWILTVVFKEVDGGTVVDCAGDYIPRKKWMPAFVAASVVRRLSARTAKPLRSIQDAAVNRQ
jgi:hypothetical protein